MAQEDSLAGIVNKKGIPTVLLLLSGLLLFISFFVGWFAVDASLQRWEYDPESSDNLGAPLGKASLDLEMKMLSLGVTAKPSNIEAMIESRGGPPSYDDAASTSGTVMLGVLLLQVALGVCFAALLGFYLLQRRRKNDYSRIVRRMFILFVVLAVVTLAYFSIRIVPAAEADEQSILRDFRLSDSGNPGELRPDIGFWLRWETKPTRNTVGTEEQMWKFTVTSGPSGGWYLTVIALAATTGARILGARNGDLSPKETGEIAPPAPPAAPPPPPPPKWTRV